VTTHDYPLLSVVLPVKDEARRLAHAVEAILAQDYPGEMEVVIAHAPSRDRTADIVAELAAADPNVVAVANPSGLTPAGLNLAIARARGTVIARVDGHAVIPPGYLRRAVELLAETGADNVGGVQEAVGQTAFERAVAAAMSSPFGVGDARFHYGGEPGPADTVYLGTFRRSALERVGGFDESLPRAQDTELNHRIRTSGGVVWFDPSLRVRYAPRGSLRGLARQYFTSGQWRRRVIEKDPSSLRWRQVVPPVTVLGIAAGIVLAASGRRLGWLAPATYAGAVGLASARVGRDLDPTARRLLPGVFATMHLCFGSGVLVGPRPLSKGTRR
jgi:succinoglycan biosynthesis protein ExoA